MSRITNTVFTLPQSMFAQGFAVDTNHNYGKTNEQYTVNPSYHNLNQAITAYNDLQKRRQKLSDDVLLKYNVIDKAFHHIKTAFVIIPKTVIRGLKGSDNFTFSDMMLVSKIPYYLGGAFLAASPFLGGDKKQGIRLAVAAGLYLIGTAFSHYFINSLYRLRYGVDLTQMYRSKTGQVEYLFASSDFPRFDLLTHRLYNKMADKMGIPDNVQDRDGAVRDNLRFIISSSRTLKLIVANILSAIGAGYIARSDAWLSMPKVFPVIRKIWKHPKAEISGKIFKTWGTFTESLRKPLMERLCIIKAPFWQKTVVLGGVGAIMGSALYILFKGLPQRQYYIGESHL